MGTDNETIRFLVEHGLSREAIQNYREGGVSPETLRGVIERRMEQGETSPEPASEENSRSFPPPASVQRLNVISAQELHEMELPPLKFLVDGILPEGISVLTAGSKIGKSWMALDLALCLTAGRPFLGRQTSRCGVLYLALEDGLRRLKERMETILGDRPIPRQFHFSTEAPKLDAGLLDTLDDHLKRYPDIGLIIIDTLQKVRGQSLRREEAYARDYREMETLKEFMDKRGVSALFLHHNRKMKDDDDPFNMILGTNGIMGAADTIWMITKAHRADPEATLHITGRDVEQVSLAIRFDGSAPTWQLMGDVDWLAEQRARQAYDGSPIVRTIRELLDRSPGHRWDGTARKLLEAGKDIAGTYIAADAQRLGYAIRGLEKPLLDYDGIVHVAGSHGTAGKKHSFYYRDLSRFENETIWKEDDDDDKT